MITYWFPFNLWLLPNTTLMNTSDINGLLIPGTQHYSLTLYSHMPQINFERSNLCLWIVLKTSGLLITIALNNIQVPHQIFSKIKGCPDSTLYISIRQAIRSSAKEVEDQMAPSKNSKDFTTIANYR